MVVWYESTGDGFVPGKEVLSEYVEFKNNAFPCSLLHTAFWVQMTANREMKYFTLKDNEYKTLMIGETAHVPFNETVQTKWVPSEKLALLDSMNFTVYRSEGKVIPVKYMHVRVCGLPRRISRVKAYYKDTLKLWVDTVKRGFKDYRFSKFDYAPTVHVRDRKFLSDRTTFESVFGDANFGVLYAYWRHEDKPEPPRRLAGKKRKIECLDEPQSYLDEQQYFDGPA